MPRESAYHQRINRVVNHITANPSHSYTVAELAAVAHLSPFHFHRLFKAITGETPVELARRIRLERAAGELLYRTPASLTDLALALGFSSSANFSKAFTAHFGCAPSQYADSNLRKIGKAPATQGWDTATPQQSTAQLTVNIVDEAPLTLAYVRHRGPYQPAVIGGLFQQLHAWADTHLADPAVDALGVTWSDSSVAEPTTWQYDAALVVPHETAGGDGVDIQQMPATTVAQLAVTLTPPDFSPIGEAWDNLLGHWLPSSPWQPAHLPSYERYSSTTAQQTTTLCLPVEPLS